MWRRSIRLDMGRLSHFLHRNIHADWINNAGGISFHLRVSANEVSDDKFCQSFSSSNPIAGLGSGKLQESGLFTRIKMNLSSVIPIAFALQYIRFGENNFDLSEYPWPVNLRWIRMGTLIVDTLRILH